MYQVPRHTSTSLMGAMVFRMCAIMRPLDFVRPMVIVCCCGRAWFYARIQVFADFYTILAGNSRMIASAAATPRPLQHLLQYSNSHSVRGNQGLWMKRPFRPARCGAFLGRWTCARRLGSVPGITGDRVLALPADRTCFVLLVSCWSWSLGTQIRRADNGLTLTSGAVSEHRLDVFQLQMPQAFWNYKKLRSRVGSCCHVLPLVN